MFELDKISWRKCNFADSTFPIVTISVLMSLCVFLVVSDCIGWLWDDLEVYHGIETQNRVVVNSSVLRNRKRLHLLHTFHRRHNGLKLFILFGGKWFDKNGSSKMY